MNLTLTPYGPDLRHQAQIMSVTENVARMNMAPIEEGRAYARYFNYEVDELIPDLEFGKTFMARLPQVQQI